MQRAALFEQQRMGRQHVRNYEERRRALGEAVERVLDRILGCWQHDLSRPFSHHGMGYRVCLKCGMSRKFDLVSWQTAGATRCHMSSEGWQADISKEPHTIDPSAPLTHQHILSL